MRSLVLDCSTPCNAPFFSTVTATYYTAIHTALYCNCTELSTALHCTTLHYIALHSTTLCNFWQSSTLMTWPKFSQVHLLSTVGPRLNSPSRGCSTTLPDICLGLPPHFTAIIKWLSVAGAVLQTDLSLIIINWFIKYVNLFSPNCENIITSKP